MKNLNWKEHGLDLLADLVGSFIFAISLQSFNAPNQIAPGGVSGLAVVLEYLTGLSIGTWSLLINIPLLATGWWILGRHFTIRTMITVVIMSAITDFAGLFLPVYTGGIYFRRRAHGDGTRFNLYARLYHRRYRHRLPFAAEMVPSYADGPCTTDD